MKKILYTLQHPAGFVFMNVMLYDGEEFRIEADTEDGGKNWDISYTQKEKEHETRK